MPSPVIGPKAHTPRDTERSTPAPGHVAPLASGEHAGKLLQLTAAIADAITDEQVFAALVDEVALALGASSAGLWLMNEGRRSARLARSVGYHASARAAFEALELDTAPPSPALDTLREGYAVWIASQEELVRRYPGLAGTVSPGRSYRIACLPVSAQGRPLGALGLTIEEARAWSDEERSFLMLVARYTGQALARLHLLEAERAARAKADATAARASMLSAASRAFAETGLDMGARLTGIVTELGRQMSSCVGVALLDSGGLLRLVAAYHPAPEAIEPLLALGQHPLRLGEGLSGKVAQDGTSVLIPEADPAELIARAAPAHRAFLERFPFYSVMCAPLRARGRIIGVVGATRTRPGESYRAEDLSLLQDLSDLAAVAIENSRLHEENAAARARAEQLYRFAHAVVSADKQEQLFDAALDAIEVALQTDRAAVLTFDAEGVMRFRSWRGLSDGYRGAVEGHSPWSAGEKDPQPVLVSDVEADDSVAAFRDLFRSEGIGSLAFFPILSRGRLLGKLMVYHRGPHHYSEQEIDIVSSIGAHLGSIVSRFSAMERLHETVHYNDLFAGILAHDLRNPLAAVVTAAQLLRMRFGDDDERASKPVSKILSSGQRMSRMIDQLLDVTRVRAGGGIQIQRQRIDLVEVCEQVAGELELAHPAWVMRRQARGDTVGMWDRDRFSQVLSNLLSNAGHHGRLDEPIHIVVDGGRRDAVTIEVHNDGAVPPDLLPTLFDPFRGASTRRAQGRGLGLGLYIVKEIVRAHGGSIHVDSDEARGTTFTLTVPRAAGPA